MVDQDESELEHVHASSRSTSSDDRAPSQFHSRHNSVLGHPPYELHEHATQEEGNFAYEIEWLEGGKDPVVFLFSDRDVDRESIQTKQLNQLAFPLVVLHRTVRQHRIETDRSVEEYCSSDRR